MPDTPLPVPPNDRPYWAAWAALNLQPTETVAILRAFPSLQTAWMAGVNALHQAGIPAATAERIARTRPEITPQSFLPSLAAAGIAMHLMPDPDYPARLRHIPDPPIALFCRGHMRSQELAVAIVGTRRASDYGRQMAGQLAADLAAAGVTVVSGLALGIDTCAHTGATRARGRTVAILGGGIDPPTLYPPSNVRLAERIIAEGGAVVSEYLPGTPSLPYRFPLRNRIIAGWGLATVVVEAPMKSGAMITARLSLEYDREVFAVPGRATDPNAEGPNHLIARGAALARTARDIAQNLGLAWEESPAAAVPETDENGHAVLDGLDEPRTLHELQRRLGLPPATIATTVTLLEVAGHVQRLPSGKYFRVR
ncbi:MAG: DNA processing protein [Parcubacteria group bacterium Gr01-1014_31]|nr:MAG: DNA processing protein [Parcubacteria group bacterium Gr01-1014_31]